MVIFASNTLFRQILKNQMEFNKIFNNFFNKDVNKIVNSANLLQAQ